MRDRLRVGMILAVYGLIYTFIIVALGRFLLFGGLGLSLWESSLSGTSGEFWAETSDLAVEIALGIVFGIALGIGFGIVYGIASGIASGIGFGIIFGIASGVPSGIAGWIAGGIAGGMAYGIAAGIVYGIALEIAYGIAFGIALGIVVGIVYGIAFGIAAGIAFGIMSLRAYYYPWHLLTRLFAPTAIGYRWHPAAWDDLFSLPFAGLDRLLIAYREDSPSLGDAEIERLITSYPSQRTEALKARTTVIAHEAAAIGLSGLDAAIAKLPEGDSGFLAQTLRVREMVADIAEAKRHLDIVDRPFLREPYAETLVSKIEAFRGQVSGFREPLATEFRNAADVWLTKAHAELEQVQKITEREPTPQVFRAGDPVNRSQEAFVPRLGVIGQVERQLTLANGCPGLLIYGRRRMGKSTLIRNLDDFVPETVRIAIISMHEPAAFTSIPHFSRRLKAELGDAGGSGDDDLDGLYESLDRANLDLEERNGRLVLALDEFETIDVKIGEGVFPQDLLATLRESIQNHRRLIWAFAGSHHITELTNAEWPSFLVSAQTIEIPPFSLAETQLLLTDPLKQSPLYRDEAKRPRFKPGFWGEGGIEWIQDQTAGWPHLVQLLASTAVDLTNESVADCLDESMLEEAAERSIVSGDVVLRQLVHGETKSEPEASYIARFRRERIQALPEDEAILQSLRHRQIIADEDGGWRLKVPLMQRWLETRG